MLTKRDKDILKYITNYYKHTHFYPSYEEIGKGTGLFSKASVYAHMKKLEDEGIVIRKSDYSRQYRIKDIDKLINDQAEEGGWILCSERMPEEHESIFAKFKGTNKWSAAMFEKISNDVNTTVEYEDGKRKTETLHTIDGKWKTDIAIVKYNVIAWQPLPEPYRL